MEHSFSPFLIQFTDTFGIRYYSLAYLLGTLFTYWWLIAVAKYDKEKIADFVLYGFLAIIIGGRLGEVFFYHPEWIWTDFWKIVKIWQGGMSFHGGFLAVLLWFVYFVRKNKWDAWKLADSVVVPAIFGVAMAKGGNFMNGELWGRPTDVSWCFIFPHADDLCRHPSQLYQAIGYILVGVLLMISYLKKVPKGVLTSLFLIGYGLVRISIEIFWRQPDWIFWGITSGTWLSLPMIITGFVLLSSRLSFSVKQDLHIL